MPSLNTVDKIPKDIIILANKRHLSEIKVILPFLSRPQLLNKLNDDIYRISCPPHKKYAPKLLNRMTLADLHGKSTKIELVYDFEGSAEFYKKATFKKGFKVISDEFSFMRSKKLYEGFGLIEIKLRTILISTEKKHIEKLEPLNYRSSLPDHKLSQFGLSELFENILFQPASEEYMLRKWNESEKTDTDFIMIAKMTKLDELNFPISAKDLEILRTQRNKCMHFKVISVLDYNETLNSINAYLRANAINEFAILVNTTFSSLNDSIKQVQNSIAPIIDFLKDMGYVNKMNVIQR